MDEAEMKHLKTLAILGALALLTSCADTQSDGEREIVDIPRQQNTDAQPGGLFHDFVIDGKTDAAGHPVGAEVFDGAERCEPTTGIDAKVGIAAEIGFDEAGILCQSETQRLGDGTFALNARALMMASKSNPSADSEILEITVFDLDGEEIATRSITAADFGEQGAEQDLAVTFRHRGDSAVRFEVRWTGNASARLTYVEVFRSTPRLVISPASQPLEISGGPTFEIEMQDPPDNLRFEVYCDEMDLSQRLVDLIESGDAFWTDTEFRTLVEAPADQLMADCPSPSRVTVRAMAGEWERNTSRVTYYAEPIPCEYVGEATAETRILLTGFEPFPADSDRDNSSKEAVEAYANGALPAGVAVMRAILPVEYDSAAALLEDMIDRCEPDIVVGFGQGRSVVDIERTAYNRKDTAAVAGGVPDNRGFVYGGAPIVEDGPAEMTTELPIESILSKLDAAGINARESNDPGRYICNNIFYATMNSVAESDRLGGFVHLPRIPFVGDAEREELRQTVAAVVDSTLELR